MERRSNIRVVGIAVLLGGLLLYLAHLEEFARGRDTGHFEAVLIGLLAGLVLYHASFGFTGGWRRFVREGRGRGLRAQLLLIGLICLVSYPLIDAGSARGVILPMGLASAIGAFAFGLGMQLGGGCASGTLFTAGGGSTRMMLVLICFIAGSVWATYHWDFWASLPRSRAGISILKEFGLPWALGMLLLFLAMLWWLSLWRERRLHGAVETPVEPGSWLHGPWSIWAGAVGLAIVGISFFLFLGRPWGVTYGFAVWGAQAADALGLDPAALGYWSGWRKGDLNGSLLSSPTNASNLGILLGALTAAGLAGRFAPIWRLSTREFMTAVIGGLLMGYGARLAYGCNIGAYLGGMTSGSLHGLWWLVWGFAGSLAGIKLRALLSMDPPLKLIATA